jgi:hypothetical protein
MGEIPRFFTILNRTLQLASPGYYRNGNASEARGNIWAESPGPPGFVAGFCTSSRKMTLTDSQFLRLHGLSLRSGSAPVAHRICDTIDPAPGIDEAFD